MSNATAITNKKPVRFNKAHNNQSIGVSNLTAKDHHLKPIADNKQYRKSSITSNDTHRRQLDSSIFTAYRNSIKMNSQFNSRVSGSGASDTEDDISGR